MPAEGVTFLERLERFDQLGFDSTKNVVYIHCSPICENYARVELGYRSPPDAGQVHIEPLDLSYNFGASYDLERKEAEVTAKQESDSSKGIKLRGDRATLIAPPQAIKTGKYEIGRRMEKLCLNTRQVLDEFASMTDAARSVGSYCAKLLYHMQKKPDEPFEGFYFRFQETPTKTADTHENTASVEVEDMKKSRSNDAQAGSAAEIDVVTLR